VPLTSEVAIVWLTGVSVKANLSIYSVLLQGKDWSIHDICSYNACYNPLSYPPFFPRGDLGWYNCIPKVGVTMAQVEEARAIRKKHAENGANDHGGNLNSFQ
jgi:hypothetical protein